MNIRRRLEGLEERLRTRLGGDQGATAARSPKRTGQSFAGSGTVGGEGPGEGGS
jgi:hypothetical protein